MNTADPEQAGGAGPGGSGSRDADSVGSGGSGGRGFRGFRGVRGRHRGGVLAEAWSAGPGGAEEVQAHSHAGWQLTLSPDFPGVYRACGADHAVPVGSLCVVAPGEAHACRDPFAREAPATWRVLTVDADTMQEAGAGPAAGGFRLTEDPGAVAAAERLHRAVLTAGRSAVPEALAGLALALRRLGGGAPLPAAGPSAGLRRARELLEASPAAPAPLDRLAEEAGLSRSHFVRAFGAAFGVTPGRYGAWRRADLAKRVLASEPGMPLAEVAFRCGFSDQSHLHRWVVRVTGTTPARYRAACAAG